MYSYVAWPLYLIVPFLSYTESYNGILISCGSLFSPLIPNAFLAIRLVFQSLSDACSLCLQVSLSTNCTDEFGYDSSQFVLTFLSSSERDICNYIYEALFSLLSLNTFQATHFQLHS